MLVGLLIWNRQARRLNSALTTLRAQEEWLTLIHGYLDLMRRFADSEAVMNPFITTWRPSIGQTYYGEDVREVMAWSKKALNLVSRVDVFGSSLRLISAAKQAQRYGTLECVTELVAVVMFLGGVARRLVDGRKGNQPK